MPNQIILVKNGSEEVEQKWVASLGEKLPGFNVLPHAATVNSDDVRYIVGWCPDAQWVNTFRNIKCLVSIGSGVDHILSLDLLRPDIPVLRTVDAELTQRMCEFGVLSVIASHRRFPEMVRNTQSRTWQRYPEKVASQVTVGILGYGAMGKSLAEHLMRIGYNVRIWAKTSRNAPGVEYYFDWEGIRPMLTEVDILVCLLPLTTETRGILNASHFELLRDGASVINLARGGHVNYADLENALNSGKLSSAILDGLPEEPLPETSPLWNLPNVVITSHSAAYISPASGPAIIAANILRLDNGQPVGPMYDAKLGY